MDLQVSGESLMAMWKEVESEILHFTGHVRQLPVLPQISPLALRHELETRYTFTTSLPADKVIADVIDLMRKGIVQVTHPRYFGLFNPSVRQISIVADALAALYNPQLATWTHAPAANELERLVLHYFIRALGWHPNTAIGHFTSGGAEANLSAALTAIMEHFPASAEAGIASLKVRPAIYLTSESHHSFVKIARMTGLGTSCLRNVPTNSQYTIDPNALVQCIEADMRNNWYPLMIVGTAGTTGGGMIDSLPIIAEIAQRFRTWFHVDAAWGGSAMLSPTLRPILTGIELADSVTWDAHKWLSVPMGAGMFFCRHPEAVKQAFAVSASYMPVAAGGDRIDQYTASAQWSRRMIGLKVFMSLAELGASGYASLIDHQAKMGNLIRLRLREAGWIVTNDTKLPVICFSHTDLQAGHITTKAVLDIIYQRNLVWLSEVMLGQRERVLRACVTSFHTNEEDVACLIDELEHARLTLSNSTVPAPRAKGQ